MVWIPQFENHYFQRWPEDDSRSRPMIQYGSAWWRLGTKSSYQLQYSKGLPFLMIISKYLTWEFKQKRSTVEILKPQRQESGVEQAYGRPFWKCVCWAIHVCFKNTFSCQNRGKYHHKGERLRNERGSTSKGAKGGV